ncbi:MAG: hypothetical protein ACHQLA_05170 [Ignavibacteriales bacterium]
MSGKATLLLIVGFSLLFLVVSKNFGDVSNRAVDNFVNYHMETVAHDIAVSGANIAANQIFMDPTWDDGYSDLPFQDGNMDISVQILDPFKNIRQITSTGNFQGHTSTVQVKLAPSKFSKFAYYSVSEGGTIWWIGSDTVWGPFHTQDYMRVKSHPVYFGKATTKRNMIYYTSEAADKPRFFGGYDQGVNLPLPTTAVDDMESNATLSFTGHDTVYMTFSQDTLKYKYAHNALYTPVYLPTAASNGLIFAKNCVVRLKGTIKGQYTIGCSSSGTIGKGTIWLDNDIVYNQDPRIYPNSIDMLGICAENSVVITQNTANNSDINIHASIYCEKGGFGAQNYSTRPISGNINLLGGIIQYTRAAVGTFGSDGKIKNGFAKRYKYDERFLVASPPFFPGTGGFEIVSWYE